MAPEVERRLAAILSADVVGYSRLMAEDEAGTVRMLNAYRDQVGALVGEHRGRVVDFAGDNFLAEFPTATDAVAAAAEIQRVIKARNAAVPAGRAMEFRIGVHLGEVRAEGERIYGDGVNIAARLEGLAEHGGICVSGTVLEQIRRRLELDFDDLGEQTVKNIPDPVHAYRLRETLKPAAQEAPPRPFPRVAVASVLAVAAVLLVVVAYLWTRTPTSIPIRSLAVLPLDNLSGDPGQEYFADGMTEALIANLARISGLRVISRTSSMAYKNSNQTLPQIASELNVDGVVEGSVLRAGDRVRITTQLISADSDDHLWSDSYERDLEDVLALQSEVAKAIAGEIELKLVPAQARGGERPVDPEAFEAYLKGRHHWNRRTAADVTRSIEYFEAAIARDPEWGPAHSALAEAYVVLPVYQPTEDNHRAMRAARAAAEQALDLDDGLAPAHNALAAVHAWYDWDWPAAEAEFKRALELDPSYAMARYWYALHLTSQRRDGALEEVHRARELDPLSALITGGVGLISFYSGDYERAIEEAQNSIELDPLFPFARTQLARAYLETGMHEEAVAVAERSVQIDGAEPRALGNLAEIYARAGRRADALRILGELPADTIEPRDLAAVHAALADADAAFDWLEKAHDDRSMWIVFLNIDPAFGSLRSDPRFDDLLSRIGLPES